MKLFKWIKGRQGTDYWKYPIISFSFIPFDLYILKFPPGSSVPKHKDPVLKFRHFRLNIIIKKPKMGGEFICSNCIINKPRIKLFRPDVYEHSVTKIEKGTRYVISFGFVI